MILADALLVLLPQIAVGDMMEAGKFILLKQQHSKHQVQTKSKNLQEPEVKRQLSDKDSGRRRRNRDNKA